MRPRLQGRSLKSNHKALGSNPEALNLDSKLLNIALKPETSFLIIRLRRLRLQPRGSKQGFVLSTLATGGTRG